jgi:ubiquitin-protein ligase E3 A
MRVESNLYGVLNLCDSYSSYLAVKYHLSSSLGIPEKTFELFHNNAKLQGEFDLPSDAIITLVAFEPLRYSILNSSPLQIYNKIRFNPTEVDIRRLILLPTFSTAVVVNKLFLRHHIRVIKVLGWQRVFKYVLQYPKMAMNVSSVAKRSLMSRTNMVGKNRSMRWFVEGTLSGMIEKRDIGERVYLTDLCQLLVSRSFLDTLDIQLCMVKIESKLTELFNKTVKKALDYINSLYYTDSRDPLIPHTDVSFFHELVKQVIYIFGSNAFQYNWLAINTTFIVELPLSMKTIAFAIRMHDATGTTKEFLNSELFITWLELLQLSETLCSVESSPGLRPTHYVRTRDIIDKVVKELGIQYLSRFQFMRDTSKYLSFDTKLALLYHDISALTPSNTLSLEVDRNSVIEDSYELLNDPSQIYNVDVTFRGEQGYGDGVRREFFSLLVLELVNPDIGLFEISPSGLYFPVPHIFQESDNTYYFELLGVALRYCMLYQITLPVSFPTVFFSYLQEDFNEIVYRIDLKELDPNMVSSLTKLQDLPKDVFESLDMEWEMDVVSGPFSELVQFINPYKPMERTVQYEDIYLYVSRCIRERLVDQVKPLLSYTQTTFLNIYESVGLLRLFKPKELQRVFQGDSEINTKAWKDATETSGFGDEEKYIIDWFWEIMEGLSVDKRKLMYRFVTGLTSMPLHNIVYKITAVDEQCLPYSNTCFFQLNLYNGYYLKEDLERDLNTAMHNQQFLNE